MQSFIGHIDLKSWCSHVRSTYPLNEPEVDIKTLVEFDLRTDIQKMVEEQGR